LITAYLKVVFMAAKGFDTTSLMSEFTTIFNMLTGKDKSGEILSVGGGGGGHPYLDSFRNTPDTNFGV
jgi:hypothetical protein